MEPVLHIRNGRAQRLPHVRGGGETWCGKKLVGTPEGTEDGIETFLAYGNTIRATMAPGKGTCPHCRRAFDAAYNAAFPDGLKPIATFRLDSAEDMEAAKALLSPDALRKRFSRPLGPAHAPELSQGGQDA